MSVSPKDLCERLIHADSEEEVIGILESASYWDNPQCWRDLGDRKGNYGTSGAQQSLAVAALVEKLVNAVDARLMNECLLQRFKLEGPSAPPSVRHAVAKFIQGLKDSDESNGLIENMLPEERNEQAKKITLAATGAKPPGKPSISIVDEGEGQTPEQIPHTFMSLNDSNKLRVPFVQGRYNMGGTGALRFCGKNKMQLIVTRRNPAIASGDHQDDGKWGFTVARREKPKGGDRRSVYRYLAPMGADDKRQGGVLRFTSESLPLKPKGNEPYVDELRHGSLVKLYEYKYPSRSHILRRDGLLRQVDVRLPSPALPIMFHECRNFRGHAGSFNTPCTGLSVRLSDNKDGNVEDIFHDSLTIEGQEFSIRYYVFKEGKTKTYLNKSGGVLFLVNGQVQGELSAGFYRRNKISFDYIADSLLACVDCSKLDPVSHEELFMTNRENLAMDADFTANVITELEKKVSESGPLNSANYRRQNEKLQKDVLDDKALEDIMQKLMRKSPTLNALFLKGEKIASPKSQSYVGSQSNFEGKEFPTYFHFKKKKAGEIISKKCEHGRRLRIDFDTDAKNDYFERTKDSGYYKVFAYKDGHDVEIPNHSMTPYNGTARFHMPLPGAFKAGDEFTLKFEVGDIARPEPFFNQAKMQVIPYVATESNPGTPRVPPSDPDGDDHLVSSKLSMPKIYSVKEKNWDKHGFDKSSALKIYRNKNNDGDESKKSYNFYVNEDNEYLHQELRVSKGNDDLLRRQFTVGLVLIGLSLIYKAKEGEEESIADHVFSVTSAEAMVLIPMINSLSPLSLKDIKIAEEN